MTPAAAQHSGAGATRLNSLTGARFVAALGVFLFHATGSFPPGSAFGTALAFVGRDGGFGVTFFFVLSGFVLAWSWQPGRPAREFYQRRFARIAPAYWVALAYGLLWVFILKGSLVREVFSALPAMVGLQAWFPDPAVHFAANGVEWSVSAELFFYALFPLLIRLTGQRRRLILLVGMAITLAFIAPVLLRAALPINIVSWALNILPAARLGEFMCGILIAVALRNGRRLPINRWTAIILFGACYLFLPMAPSWLPQGQIFLLSVILVIIALAQADIRGTRTLIGSRIPVRLGEWSYCFYLVHQMTSQIAFRLSTNLVHSRALGPVWIVSSVACSIGLAALLYYVVERPFERRLRPRRPVLSPPPTEVRAAAPLRVNDLHPPERSRATVPLLVQQPPRA